MLGAVSNCNSGSETNLGFPSEIVVWEQNNLNIKLPSKIALPILCPEDWEEILESLYDTNLLREQTASRLSD